MRTTVMTWVTSSVLLIGGAFLVALAQGAKERLEAQSNCTLSIDTRELTEKAMGPLPLQFYDVI